jgi:hypothetical protein
MFARIALSYTPIAGLIAGRGDLSSVGNVA